MQSPSYYEFLGRPKLISGKRALEQIPVELEGYGAARPLVIADGAASGIGPAIVKAMFDSNLAIGALFDGHVAGSTSGIVRELAGLYAARKCDSIIVAGGGSLVDAAKCVNIEVCEKQSAARFAGENRIHRELRPIVLVPTALVTGYEAARYASIDGEIIGSDFLSPDIVVIDSRITSTAGSNPTLVSGLTALAHSIEASISPGANPMIDAYAYASIRLLCENLPAAVRKPKNGGKSMAVANGCALAGTVFSNAPAGMAHYLAEALSDGTGVNPGIFMGILVRSLLKARLAAKTGFRDELCLALAGPDIYSSSEASKRPQAAIQSLDSMFNELGSGVPSNLESAGVSRERLGSAARQAAAASPSKLSAKECGNLLERAWGGK
ncbi:MAG: iron-containing alcohol dehydrogenase [Spirochaetes bacterium]|jgi:alcohol dehydrogenase|nr:iron-containing alcohol dehydrogenase [Spirochaetota bacterium]